MKIVSENKCNDSLKSLLKLTKGEENLDKLLESQCVSFNKEGLGFQSNDKKRLNKTLLH